jgi:hypothetical protein
LRALRDSVSIHDAIRAHPDPELRQLLSNVVQTLSEFDDCDLADMVCFLIVEPGDTLAQVDAQLNFPILSNRFDGQPFGSPDFTPSWDVLEAHAHWYELVFVMSDDGFGLEVFIPKHPEVPAELLAMCAMYYEPAPQEPLP